MTASMPRSRAIDREVSDKEVELIRLHRSNDPAVGYNRWPILDDTAWLRDQYVEQSRSPSGMSIQSRTTC